MLRVHHCVADRIALIAVPQPMIDRGIEPPKRRRNCATDESAGDWISDTLICGAVKALDAARKGVLNAAEVLIEPKYGSECFTVALLIINSTKAKFLHG